MKKKECPFCGEEIAASAKKCRYCGERLTDAYKATIIEANADEEESEDEDYWGIDDSRERARIEKEERDFRRTLFSRIAGLIAQYNGESYWYQIFEKYEVWMVLSIVLIVNVVILFVAASVGWLFDICTPLAGIIAAAQYTMVGGLIAGLVLLIDHDNKDGKDRAESGELSMVLYSLGARVIQFVFLLSPVYLVYSMSPISPDSQFKVNEWSAYWPVLLLSLPLYIGYIRFFIWTGGEISAYKTWICNVGCGNYDFLHSNRFRYWNSLAEQEADQVNMRYLRGYRFISLRCMMMIPAASLFFSILMMTARPNIFTYWKEMFIPEQVQSSAEVKQIDAKQTETKLAEAKLTDAAQAVRLFYESCLKSLDKGDDDEVAALNGRSRINISNSSGSRQIQNRNISNRQTARFELPIGITNLNQYEYFQ